jgi:hypothetical protein
MMPLALRRLFGAAVFLLFATGRAWAIDIGEVRWGFDGRATPQSFNLLSVLVSNNGPTPFEGKFELCESIGSGRRVGAVLAEDLYIAPNSSRWVQFYPYVKEPYEEWWLQWGRRAGERADVRRPVLQNQGLVMLVASDDVLGVGRALRQFPDYLFPPMVTATDGLTEVLLDHVPQWEESRRQSFYDWLYRGGQLHILKGADGTYPRFTAQLAELNDPSERFRVGNGTVIRHDRSRSRIDAAFVNTLTAGKDRSGDPTEDGEAPSAPANPPNGSAAMPVAVRGGASGALFPDLCGGLFAFLKTLNKPHHNWVLIYAMALVYVVTVVPGVHYLGRKRVDYRLVYGTLVGLIVLFSVGFAYFGRRGHREASAVNSLAVARQLPGGAWDITSWSNVFVINGADYEIVHGGSERLYSTAQTFEAVNGTIRNGSPGRFDVDIPPFSSQPFVGRLKVNGDRKLLNVLEFSGEPALKKLVLEPTSSFPRPAGDEFVYVLFGDRFQRMSWSGGRLTLSDSAPGSMTEFFSTVEWGDLSPFAIRGGRFGRVDQQDQGPPPFDKLMRPFIAWSLDLRKQGDLHTTHLPTDHARLFVWSELPDTLKIENKMMPSQQGRVLYVIDVPRPVKP